MLETAIYDCPYCGEEVETTVDLSGGDQEYICLLYTSDAADE